MDLDFVLEKVSPGKAEETEAALRNYNTENRAVFTFASIDVEKRKKLCEAVFEVLDKGVPTSCQILCLEALRILSRDKHVLQPVTTMENMQILMKLAKLEPKLKSLGQESDFPVVVESLKCLCNIVFNSEGAQRLSRELDIASMLCGLLEKCKDQRDIKCFNLRLIFLLSLLDINIRGQLRGELQAIPKLTQALENTLNIQWAKKYLVVTKKNSAPLCMQDTDCTIEALKALFNVTLDCWTVHNESEAHQYRYLAAILRHVLLSSAPNESKTEDLHSNAVNLLSNIPVSCVDVLICQPGKSVNDNDVNMEAVQVLVDFMEMRIDKGCSYREGLSPVLSLLTQCSRAHRHFRKYIKAEVLPPLRDVSSRPEVGTTIRNKLVRLMTHVDLGVKQMAAEFLFVLCKERVDNLLKYTGYGNAAGLLAARGLLAGGRGESWYSDDDDDTDTEEYKSAKPNINLITGHVEEPLPNPIDEMTEEQKEYEAMKLVNMFDKLSREDIIKPMGVRPDGTMAPLQETIHRIPTPEPDSSDSD